MSNNYKYTLEKGSKKHQCPGCNFKRYVRYIDVEANSYLPLQYGRCDRESKCGYNVNPYADGYSVCNATPITNNYMHKNNTRTREALQQQNDIINFIPADIFINTLKGYQQNTFIQNLLYNINYPLEPVDIEKVISFYYLGTITKGYRAGAVTFPFIDLNNNVRAVQVKMFDTENHTTATDFLHSIIEKYCTRNKKSLPQWLEAYMKQDKRISCLFGEHLLSKYPTNPIALVEAPKTAVYGSLYFGFPDVSNNFIWLAVYNKSSFTSDKLKVLKGRTVYVFPDLSKDGCTFKEWQTKARAIEKQLHGTRFIFSDLLEQLAPDTDRNNGNDLADFLIKLDWRSFRANKPAEIPVQTTQVM